MIIIDISGIMYSVVLSSKEIIINENSLRHMILNSIRSYRKKFPNYGKIIIACDSNNYWRKQVFPFYKSNRKKFFENSNLDWNLIFDSFRKIKDELKEYFPYKIIEVESAEADDIIATIVNKHGWNKLAYMPDEIIGCKILIISKDKDFIQLQKYSNVKQYSPIEKKWIEHDDPNKYLLEHIMKGDVGDGIPSILCEDNYYVDENHQIKRLTQKKINDLISRNKNEWPTNIQKNFDRNSLLISLVDGHIPRDIQDKILDQYENYIENDRSRLMNYFIKYKLKNLLSDIGDF